MSRRVTIKTLLVNQQRASPQSLAKHLRYIERDGVGRDGEPGQAYGPQTDAADLDAFKERCADDRHHFRFILSPEDGAELDDLRTYTRHLMGRMEADLGTGLDWVAVNHWNTDNPHTHIVARARRHRQRPHHRGRLHRRWVPPSRRRTGDRMAGATHRAGDPADLAARGGSGAVDEPGSHLEARGRRGWPGADRTVQRTATATSAPAADRPAATLAAPGLADETQPGTWAVHADAEKTLRALGERSDIIRTTARHARRARGLAVFEPGDDGRTIIGRVAAKGLADELRDRGYLVIDGVDGKAHYVALNARDERRTIPPARWWR